MLQIPPIGQFNILTYTFQEPPAYRLIKPPHRPRYERVHRPPEIIKSRSIKLHTKLLPITQSHHPNTIQSCPNIFPRPQNISVRRRSAWQEPILHIKSFNIQKTSPLHCRRPTQYIHN